MMSFGEFLNNEFPSVKFTVTVTSSARFLFDRLLIFSLRVEGFEIKNMILEEVH